MLEVSLLILFVFSAAAMTNWRWGFALCTLMAMLQGPLRKLVVDQPVYFVMFVGVVFLGAIFGAMLKRIPLLPHRIEGWTKNVGVPFHLFLALIMLQALHSLITLGNPIVSGIGLLSYLAPIPAIALAYQYALRQGAIGILRWMRFYVILATLAITTVFIEYLGFDWIILGQVGADMMISYGNQQYKGNAGIFRATEIAAWHASAIACFSFILFWGKRFTVSRIILAILFITFLVGLGALTGRRKMIIQIVIFLSTYIGLITWFRRGNGRVAVMSFVLGIIGYIGVAGWWAPDPGDKFFVQASQSSVGANPNIILERTETVFTDVPARIKKLGIEPISWAVAEHGWLGAGLGVGSQGAQHFGAKGSGAAEGGLGKLTLELGVPGLLLVLWMLFAFSRYIWRLLAYLAKYAPASYANLGYGLVAFMLANVAAFSVATQAYGDVFILLTLGISLGFLLALPTLSRMQTKAGRG